MADVIGLSDVSSDDTGKGSQLKTGNLKRSYNMPKACVQRKMKQGMSSKAAHKACYPKKKASKKKPTKQMSSDESRVWSNYIRKGSLYNPAGQDSVVLDSLIRSKMKK
tara:strand:- start:601 stop:924 length:324 start_codon:yes stop_codon:yes gene_type:complete